MEKVRMDPKEKEIYDRIAYYTDLEELEEVKNEIGEEKFYQIWYEIKDWEDYLEEKSFNEELGIED